MNSNELFTESFRRLLREELGPQRRDIDQLKNAVSVLQDTVGERRPSHSERGEQLRSRPPPRRSDLCFECNQPGHYGRDCELRRARQLDPANNPTTTEPDIGNARSVNGNSCAYLHAEIDGKTMNVMVDTGTKTSLLPALCPL